MSFSVKDLTQRAFLLPEMRFKIFPEVLDRALKRLNCTGRQGAEGISRCKQLAMERKAFDVSGFASAFFDGVEDFFRPGKTVAARCAPARTRVQRISSDYARNRQGRSCHPERPWSRYPFCCLPSSRNQNPSSHQDGPLPESPLMRRRG